MVKAFGSELALALSLRFCTGAVFPFPWTSRAAVLATEIRRSVEALASRMTESRKLNGVAFGSADAEFNAETLAAVALFGVPFLRPPRRSPGRDPRGIAALLFSLFHHVSVRALQCPL
jgi:hypothetical protein